MTYIHNSAEIAVREDGYGSLILNGEDLSTKIDGFHIEYKSGARPSLYLSFPLDEVKVSLDGVDVE